MDKQYDPLTSPLELPVNIMRISCRPQEPVRFIDAPGSTPVSLWRGAMGEAMKKAGCPKDIISPHSKAHKRDFPRPVRIELKSPYYTWLETFELELTLWGRRAQRSLDHVMEAVQLMGEEGILLEGNKKKFGVEKISPFLSGTLGELSENLFPDSASMVLLELITPYMFYVKEQAGRGGRHAMEFAEDFPLKDAMERTAFQAAAWDMEDRGMEGADRKELDRISKCAEHQAGEDASRVEVIKSFLLPYHGGSRYSKRSKGDFELKGVFGYVVLEGPIKPLQPWLAVMEYWGGGQKISFGFGRAKVWSRT